MADENVNGPLLEIGWPIDLSTCPLTILKPFFTLRINLNIKGTSLADIFSLNPQAVAPALSLISRSQLSLSLSLSSALLSLDPLRSGTAPKVAMTVSGRAVVAARSRVSVARLLAAEGMYAQSLLRSTMAMAGIPHPRSTSVVFGSAAAVTRIEDRRRRPWIPSPSTTPMGDPGYLDDGGRGCELPRWRRRWIQVTSDLSFLNDGGLRSRPPRQLRWPWRSGGSGSGCRRGGAAS